MFIERHCSENDSKMSLLEYVLKILFCNLDKEEMTIDWVKYEAEDFLAQ